MDMILQRRFMQIHGAKMLIWCSTFTIALIYRGIAAKPYVRNAVKSTALLMIRMIHAMMFVPAAENSPIPATALFNIAHIAKSGIALFTVPMNVAVNIRSANTADYNTASISRMKPLKIAAVGKIGVSYVMKNSANT